MLGCGSGSVVLAGHHSVPVITAQHCEAVMASCARQTFAVYSNHRLRPSYHPHCTLHTCHSPCLHSAASISQCLYPRPSRADADARLVNTGHHHPPACHGSYNGSNNHTVRHSRIHALSTRPDNWICRCCAAGACRARVYLCIRHSASECAPRAWCWHR